MDDDEVHTQFDVLRRPTARCDECHKKGRGVINKCQQCAAFFCNACLDGPELTSHTRSAEESALAVAQEQSTLARLDKLAKKKEARAIRHKTGVDSRVLEEDASPKKSPSESQMGLFRTSPKQQARIPAHDSTQKAASSESSSSPPDFASSVRTDHTGTGVMSPTEFGNVARNPWNRANFSFGGREDIVETGSDTESDGRGSDREAAGGEKHDEGYDDIRGPGDSPSKRFSTPSTPRLAPAMGDMARTYYHSPRRSKQLATGAADLLRARLSIQNRKRSVTAKRSDVPKVPATPVRQVAILPKTPLKAITPDLPVDETVTVDEHSGSVKGEHVPAVMSIRFDLKIATEKTLNSEMMEEVYREYKVSPPRDGPSHESFGTNTDSEFDQWRGREERAPEMSSQHTKSLFASNNDLKYDAYGIDLLLAAAEHLDAR